jgi:hypothetical protein
MTKTKSHSFVLFPRKEVREGSVLLARTEMQISRHEDFDTTDVIYRYLLQYLF